jgi:hypothetical protein
MKNPSYVAKSITVLGADGNHVAVSETAERQEVVISMRRRIEHKTSVGVFAGVAR